MFEYGWQCDGVYGYYGGVGNVIYGGEDSVDIQGVDGQVVVQFVLLQVYYVVEIFGDVGVFQYYGYEYEQWYCYQGEVVYGVLYL